MNKIIIFILFSFLISCVRTESDLLVFFITSGQVYSIDTDGNNIKRLTNDAKTYISLSSSIDGEELIVSDNTSIYLLHYKGGTPSYLTEGRYGTYGPSGKIYFALKGGSYHNIIARCDPDGKNITSLKIMAADVDIFSISCNYNESEVAIYYWQSGPSYPARMDLITLSDPQIITNGARHPAYSTSDNNLLVVSDIGSFIRITYPDSTYINIHTIASGICPKPAWTPDGEYIFFSENNPSPKQIKRIKYDGSETATININFNTNIEAFCVQGKPR